jgi:UDP-N-acetylglucosamine--N-acetylmuramyl-(pentapeptide) pyrophosphoryl-undecaprenol N-acetylglucosamine transferase
LSITINNHNNSTFNSSFAGLNPSFLIAGGGTGGHIFPAIAIANAIKKINPNAQILFIGAKGKMEMEKVPQAGYSIEGIDITGFNRSSLLKNIFLPFKLIKSFWQVKGIVSRFKPTAAIGVGGYSSFPVLKYCQQKRIKTFIHESNSFAGKSNIILGKKATKIFVANEGMQKFFPKQKLLITGNPVRKSIVESKINREEAIRFFGLDVQKKTILAVGGSLGAKSINEAIAKDLIKFEANNIQLIWQTGKTTASQFAAIAKDKSGVWVNAFIEKMEIAYAAADVVISRSGAMSVAELCVANKPVIFVPFPFAAEDHQTVNAMHLVNKNAAWVIKDNQVENDLVNLTIDLVIDESRQNELKSNIKKLAITNADEVIAKEIFNSLSY